MTLWQALLFIAVVGTLAVLDIYYFEWGAVTFLGKQLMRITEWMAFWR